VLNKIVSILRMHGFTGLFHSVYSKLTLPRAECFQSIRPNLENMSGIEIGGPSPIFSFNGLLPIYSYIGSLDNCNFSDKTTWEGEIRPGQTFKFNRHREAGEQLISEATNLSICDSNAYDVVLSSHAIEHSANPLLALKEWKRILKTNGFLILIVPHKDGTFDHKRPLTSFEHIIQDFENNVGENDLTHLDEILEFHDLRKDPGGSDFNAFKARSINNAENRCLHQHVFNTALAIEMVNYSNFKIINIELKRPYHIIVIAQKLATEESIDNSIFRAKASFITKSPFKSDKIN
jgi:SAM-dependent methyltransferase